MWEPSRLSRSVSIVSESCPCSFAQPAFLYFPMPFGTVFFGVSVVPFGSFGTPGDVMSAWYGIRPLCGDPNAKDQSSASRDHVVAWCDDCDASVDGY